MALTKIGATLGGSADVIQVTQSSHGLSLGFPVKVSGNGTYAHASADSSANAEAIGIIIATTTDTMTIALGGRITINGVLPSGNLAAGTVLFLHTSAGKLTATEPSGNNEVSKPMAVITYLNSEMIMIQQRGEVISTSGVVSAPTDAQYVTLAVDSTLSAERVLTAGSGITLTDAGSNGAATISIANNAIDSQHYSTASIDNEHLADNAVDSAEIAADAVTNAKLANMATRTVKANATSGSANPTDVVMADGDFLIANGSALVTVPITGDVVISNAGVATIQTDAVDIAMLSATQTASSSTFLRGDNRWEAAGATDISVRVYRDAHMSIPNNAFTNIQFNTARFNTDSNWSSSTSGTPPTNAKLVATTAGKYIIGFNGRWANNTTGQRAFMIMLNNTTGIARVISADNHTNYDTEHYVGCLWDMSAGDYITVQAYQNSGGALNVESLQGPISPEFWMIKLA